MACDNRIAHASNGRILTPTHVHDELAARMEVATTRPVDRARDVTGDGRGDRATTRRRLRRSLQQRLRVWMQRLGEQRLRRRLLDDSPEVHHCNVLADV